MGEVSVRDLRNHGGEVLDRVTRGEGVTITRAGKPVAELRAIRPAGLSAATLLERWRRLPHVDGAAFRADIDAVVDSSL
jgi:antitoxin (DNA-binding transcriptional repressor) of toxin-antitoxin stability system